MASATPGYTPIYLHSPLIARTSERLVKSCYLKRNDVESTAVRVRNETFICRNNNNDNKY